MIAGRERIMGLDQQGVRTVQSIKGLSAALPGQWNVRMVKICTGRDV
ncbi:hypothetical protein AA14362_2592 [Acetobacter cerevisiae DSM 14362]|nr:hypothetical protein AA14362_2592 [Acetobacter cerevisiae DSM 14362]